MIFTSTQLFLPDSVLTLNAKVFSVSLKTK